MERDTAEQRFRTVNEIMHNTKDARSLSNDTLRYLASVEFQKMAISMAQQDAAKGSGMVVLIGNGDLGHALLLELKALDSSIVGVGIDTQVTVGFSIADYVLLLTDPVPTEQPYPATTERGVTEARRLIDLLARIAPSRAGALRKWLRRIRKPQYYRPLSEQALLIGEYHGFEPRPVFEEAAELGFQVLPDVEAATLAMDKIEFATRYGGDPEFSSHILPHQQFVIGDQAHRDLWTRAATEEVAALTAHAVKAVERVGLPCMLKPAVSEFGYGQVKLDDPQKLEMALQALVEQTHRYKVNPGGRVLVESFASKKVISPISSSPVELMQMVVRHHDEHGRIAITCLPPIWFTNHESRGVGATGLKGGPQVLDIAIQAPAEEMAEFVSMDTYADICDKSTKLIESMTRMPGLFGVEIFLLQDGRFAINRVMVRTEDTMFATRATQPQSNAFALVAKLILNERLPKSELMSLPYRGGVKAVVYEGNNSDGVADISGVLDAGSVQFVQGIDIYYEKTRDPLRPLRRYGLIYVRAPDNATIGDVIGIMGQARSLIQFRNG